MKDKERRKDTIVIKRKLNSNKYWRLSNYILQQGGAVGSP